jgi:hypothetical protein
MAIRKIIKRATDSLFVNTEFDGTEAIKPPVGTTAERANAAAGDIRFNTTTSLMEYYDGNGWKSIDSPPVISSISPASIADTSSSTNITITGDFFASGATVKAIGQNLSEIAASSVTFTNSTTLVATFNGTSFADAQEDYSIEVTNVSGLTGKGVDLLAVNATPAWTVAAGSLGTVYDAGRTSLSFTTGATDDEGASLTYSVTTGSLPSGLSIASSTGTITGNTSAVGSDTTVTFTLSVTDGSNTTTRQYSILQKAPVITSYTSTGSGTFSVPTGISTVDVLVIGGGASGAYGGTSWWGGGGGGAGGLIFRPAFPVTPGGSVSYTVGTGGLGPSNGTNPGPNSPATGKEGVNSTFGTLTALGGGGGAGDGCWPLNAHVTTQNAGSGGHGGSGGGGSGPSPKSHGSVGNREGGQAQQPGRPGDSGTYGFGTHGGGGSGGPGGGGGGAGGNGDHGGAPGGDGGIGKAYSISGSSVTYAGGGGACNYPGHTGSEGQAQGSGGPGGGGNGGVSGNAQAGTANRGSGAGGGGGPSAAGGSGIIIVKY